ncbi:hypothetical protein NEOLEDRAFT_1184908 [Neolentinus lepideus HHB14362 ss-1]|uniref:Uncharacterized protein n=1 Tax=Neolentinus lepideus HHB14362 ss-1 TaxID=1314782 RepID=A0A165JVH0_9AGAM|nr:hypothetical protein NEOLEDRAFT_1184908 [Neolentinus lepideus HHB14362 ss-1]
MSSLVQSLDIYALHLRTVPNSEISLAWFHPVATSPSAATPFARRIIVETLPDNTQLWNYVPNARREEGVLDEGHWPRTVLFSQSLYICTQEQWDLFKLHPRLECFVPKPPRLPQVSILHTEYTFPPFVPSLASTLPLNYSAVSIYPPRPQWHLYGTGRINGGDASNVVGLERTSTDFSMLSLDNGRMTDDISMLSVSPSLCNSDVSMVSYRTTTDISMASCSTATDVSMASILTDATCKPSSNAEKKKGVKRYTDSMTYDSNN